MTDRPDSVEELLEGVEEMKKQWHESFDAHAKGLPFGAQNMTNVQHAQWMLEMNKRYPADGTLRPDGTPVEHPWLEALRFVEDGEKEARRFVKTMMGMAMEVSDGRSV